MRGLYDYETCGIAAAPLLPRYIRVVNQNDLVPRVGVYFFDSGERFVHLGGPSLDTNAVRYINGEGRMEPAGTAVRPLLRSSPWSSCRQCLP